MGGESSIGPRGAEPTSADAPDPEIDGAPTHPTLIQLFQYWKTIRGRKRWPSRKDFEPADIRFALGYVNLIDVMWAPLRFRYRLVGAKLVWRLGYDPTGQGPESLPDPVVRQHAIEAFSQVATTGLPRARQFERRVGRMLLTHDGIALPLSTDQQRVDMVLIGQMFAERLCLDP